MSVILQVTSAPQVEDLHFWALQASFADPGGVTGGAHLGLQWNSSYPDRGAVNWGGYDRSGSIISGTESRLPSIVGDPNTRDFPWLSGVEYLLRIRADQPGWWVGEVTNLGSGTSTVVRSLNGGGDRLVLPIVWSEVFARCDAPPSAVIWSRPKGVRLDGSAWEPDSYSVTYQREEDGGCSNTNVAALPHGVSQVTGIARNTPHGGVIPTAGH